LKKYGIVNNVSIEKIGIRLCLPKKIVESLNLLLEHYPKLAEITQLSQAQLKRWMRIPGFPILLELYGWECILDQQQWGLYQYCCSKFQTFTDTDLHPVPILRGHDLMQLGFTPGPIFHKILTSLEDQQLEGKINTYPQAIEWIKIHFEGEKIEST